MLEWHRVLALEIHSARNKYTWQIAKMQEYYVCVWGGECNINMLCSYLYKYAHYGFINLIYYYELIANELFEVMSILNFLLRYHAVS